ncbi:MAG: tetratricopeptide repeat protein [Proteobacteria bacterium]|nr:tetratricopeptide repeat protein [Pseudomonadota bacterium]
MSNKIQGAVFFRVRVSLWISLILVAAILALYWQTRTFSYIHYDDPEYVFENVRVQQGLTIENIKWAITTTHFSNWHPLTWISHMLDSELYGNNPGQHHSNNVLLHIINTLLLFNLFRKMTGDILPSALLAGLFAVHPLHIQSIAWISERKDLLCAQFFFLSILSYLKYLEKSTWSRYLLVLIFFSLGLMAKPMIITLPFVLLLLDHWPLQRFGFGFNGTNQVGLPPVIPIFPCSNTSIFLEKIPFLVLSILSAAITFHAQEAGGSVATISQLSLLARAENAIVSYVLYIQKMLWPQQLSVIYPHPGTHPYWLIIISALIFSVLTLLALFYAKKTPFFLVGWLWFVGMLIPVIGIVQVGIQAMADRYTYLPMIGLFLAFSWGLYHFPPFKNKRSLYFSITGSCILLLLSVTTWRELQYWENGVSLFTRAVTITKNNYVAHNNLGYEFVQIFEFDKAKKEFELALQINPNFEIAHLNLGRSLIEEGNIAEGIEHYRSAIKIKPDYADAHNNLGNTLFRLGKNHEAAANYIQALRINPSLTETYNNLGAILVSDDKFDQAIILFQKAISLNPNYLDAKTNLEEVIKAKKIKSQELERPH